MNRAQRTAATTLIFIALALPFSASAANVFGGKVGAYFPCFNIGSWNTVSGPRGGIYVYHLWTRTFPKGPPGPGRWTLGLFGGPDFCIVNIFPLYVLPGIFMVWEASS